jgi:hypothetical protein
MIILIVTLVLIIIITLLVFIIGILYIKKRELVIY